MSLLKVSLCINRPNQRLLCIVTRKGCRCKRSPTPRKNKNIFFAVWGAFLLLFSMGRALCYVFLLMRGFFHRMEAFLLLFLYMGAFLPRLPPGVGPFSQCGGRFCYFFLHVGGLFCLHGGFYVFMAFLWACPFHYDLFCGRACYYVTIILCHHLQWPLCTQQSPLQHPCSIHNNNEIIRTRRYTMPAKSYRTLYLLLHLLGNQHKTW